MFAVISCMESRKRVVSNHKRKEGGVLGGRFFGRQPRQIHSISISMAATQSYIAYKA